MTNKQSNFIYTVLGGALLISILLYSLSSSGGGKREEERFGISEKSSKYPIAIVVLGGGLTQNGDIPLHTQLRVNKAVEMYNNFKSTGQEAKIITLSGGTTHKPNPLDSKGFVIWESTAAARALLKLGVPPADIREENFSLDTIGNAYFLRMIHLTATSYSRLVIITNDWHMPRASAIFSHVLSLPDALDAASSNTAKGGGAGRGMQRTPLAFVSVKAGIEDPDILQARVHREQESLKTFNTITRSSIQSLEDLYVFIYSQHAAYSTSRLLAVPLVGTEAGVSDAVLKSY